MVKTLRLFTRHEKFLKCLHVHLTPIVIHVSGEIAKQIRGLKTVNFPISISKDKTGINSSQITKNKNQFTQTGAVHELRL